MEKIIIVYWSGTGNTKIMADHIYETIKKDNDNVIIKNVNDTTVKEVLSYNKIILGSPAMGLEMIEQEVFEPFYNQLKRGLLNKKIALFGSYGWGDGEWMENWSKNLLETGALLISAVTSNYEPTRETFNLLNLLAHKILIA